ncbi:fluoride efflux transporter FluC [Providencia manganoxydans]|uniref:fluoride efflux transporter FluC n=1 Tax=Providencia manganoxydans TaxID=2923283 RepID=UPI0032DB0D7D
MLTGLLGGYTTFSSMQLDALKLTQTKQKMLALFYLLLSIIAGLMAAFFGAWLIN